MHDPAEAAADGKIDLVPMIDCIMLLLLFFILTTRFTADEKQISALLPTTQGTVITPATKIDIPRDINLVVTPTGISRGLKEADYQRTWEESERLRGRAPTSAALRIGGSDPLIIDGALFSSTDQQVVLAQVEAIHAYVARELAAREETGDRTGQSPVSIHCFSGLSWGYALAVYDAVRAYEAGRQPPSTGPQHPLAESQRTMTFAPPRLRNHTPQELGRELWELTHLN
jgi:hypothetical protein